MKCEYCEKKMTQVQLVCRNCFSPHSQLESFNEFADYVDEIVEIRDAGLSALDCWKMRQRVTWVSRDLEMRLTEAGALYTPTQDANGFWTTPSGFISRENPGPMMVTASGFMSPLEMNFSSRAEDYLMGIISEEEGERLARGFVHRAGTCPCCSARIKKDSILCSKCFSPCIPQNSYDARAAYGEVMTEVGKELAAKDSPKFEAWQTAMSLAVEDMQSQVDEYEEKARAPKEELRPPQKFWMISFPCSVILGFLAVVGVEDPSARFNLGCWAFSGALILSLIIFFNLFVKCPNCRRYSLKEQSHLHRSFVGSQTGYHTEYRQTTTYTDFSDSRGRNAGSATSYSYTPVDVEHVEDVYSDLHQCTYCRTRFYKQVVKRG